jgi:hypothetical protein
MAAEAQRTGLSTRPSSLSKTTSPLSVGGFEKGSLGYVGLEWASAGIGCAIADAVMNPLEVIKVYYIDYFVAYPY